MSHSLLYCGMRNGGGPGHIGRLLWKICDEIGWQFRWLHHSTHAPPEFGTPVDITNEECMSVDFDVVLHNQWRHRPVFETFKESVQILLVMYEDIPTYWPEFCLGKNRILAPCEAVGTALSRDFPVLRFACPPRTRLKTRKSCETVRYFFPARDGGEGDRKGIGIMAQALTLTKRKFELRVSLTNEAKARYHQLCPSLFQDNRVVVLPELGPAAYWDELMDADALVCPSRTSGIELATLDARSIGLEVLVTDTPPMNSYFSASDAWLIPSRPSTFNSKDSETVSVKLFEACPNGLAQVMDRFTPGTRPCKTRTELEQEWEVFQADLTLYLNESIQI